MRVRVKNLSNIPQPIKFLLSISHSTSVTPLVSGMVAVVVLVQKFGVSVAYTVSPSFL